MEKCKVFEQGNEIINLVIINEQHSLLPQQEEVIKKELGGEIKLHKIPAEGINQKQIEDLAESLNNPVNSNKNIIVLSPIPLLLARLSHHAGMLDAMYDGTCKRNHVYILHNDLREKKELPDGRVVSAIAKDGWKLIEV